jgi:hypothetical protein
MNHLSTRLEDAVAAKGTTPEQMSCIGRVTHAYITKALDLVVSIQKDYRICTAVNHLFVMLVGAAINR